MMSENSSPSYEASGRLFKLSYRGTVWFPNAGVVRPFGGSVKFIQVSSFCHRPTLFAGINCAAFRELQQAGTAVSRFGQGKRLQCYRVNGRKKNASLFLLGILDLHSGQRDWSMRV